jgi:ATP-dependent DNA ligase
MLRSTRLAPPQFQSPCRPSPVAAPPAGPGWLHEIKHDGFRLMVRRDEARVQAFTRKGHDWAARFPAVAAAAIALRASSFLIDSEVVAADAAGLASFNLLRQRRHRKGAFCWAFDLLELEGRDLRREPIEHRKVELARFSRVRHSDWHSTSTTKETVRPCLPRLVGAGSRASCRNRPARTIVRAPRRTG